MKIVHICLASSFYDGYSYQENVLPKYHRKLGNDVTVIASMTTMGENGVVKQFQKSETYWNSDSVKVIRLEYKKGIPALNRLLRYYRGLSQTLEAEKPDVIFIHNCQFRSIKDLAKYLKVNNNVKVYVDNHVDQYNSASNWLSKNILHKIIWRRSAKMIEPYTAKFFGVTPGRVKYLVETYKIPVGKTELLVMGADDEVIRNIRREEIRRIVRNRHGIDGEGLLMISGGKIDHNKRQILLLMEAFQKIASEKVTLLIFGSVTNEMRERVLKLADGQKVKYLGWIGADDIYEYFLASDLGVFPGGHSVLWEQAVGTGLPCVFRYWEGMDHIDLGGNCRFLYLDSVDEIAGTLSKIIKDKTTIQQMKEIAMKEGRKRFSYSDIAKRSLEIN